MAHRRTSSQSVLTTSTTILGQLDPNRPSSSTSSSSGSSSMKKGPDAIREWKFPLQSASVRDAASSHHHHSVQFAVLPDHPSSSSSSISTTSTSLSAHQNDNGTFERTPVHRTRLSIAYSNPSSRRRRWFSTSIGSVARVFGLNVKRMRMHEWIQLICFLASLLAFLSALSGHGYSHSADDRSRKSELLARLDHVNAGLRQRPSATMPDARKHVLRVKVDDEALQKSPLDVLLDPTAEAAVLKGNNQDDDDALFSIELDGLVDSDADTEESAMTAAKSDDSEVDGDMQRQQDRERRGWNERLELVRPAAASNQNEGAAIQDHDHDQDRERRKRDWTDQLSLPNVKEEEDDDVMTTDTERGELPHDNEEEDQRKMMRIVRRERP